MRCTSKAIVGYWHYGVILTYLATLLGVVGIVFSAIGWTGPAVLCLLVSGLCDAFDGAVARTRRNRTDGDKAFGMQIDSLSDLIAFGIAPVMVGVSMGLTDWYYIVMYCFYALCALVRLSYFNVGEIEQKISEVRAEASGEQVENSDAGKTDKETKQSKKYFLGVPVTEISLILPIIYLIVTMINNIIATIVLMCVLYVVYAILMVIKIRIPKPRAAAVGIMSGVFVVIIVTLFLVRWFVCGVHAL